MTALDDHSDAGTATRLHGAFVPLVAVAAVIGLVVPRPGRAAADRGAINALLVVLVLTSALGVELGTARRLRANAARLGVILGASTVTLTACSWAVSRLVTDRVLRHGMLALGVAPAEIATIALVGLAGGDVAVAAAVLMCSTVVSVVIAGPVLAFEAGARVDATHVLVDLAAVVALPLVVGLAGRRFASRFRRARNLLEPTSIITVVGLVALVASQVHLSGAYIRVAASLVCFIALSTVAGAALSRLVAKPARTAVVFSTAIRDFAIASGIATSAFGATAAGPLGLYGVLVIGWGAVLAGRPQRSPAQDFS